MTITELNDGQVVGRHKQFDEGEALDAALAVFWQKSYEGASFDDLTKATGIARPGLYAAFGNKASLFGKALDLYQTKYMCFMTEALDAPTSLKVVEHMLRGALALHTLDAAHPGCLGINGALACSDDAEAIRRELVRRRELAQALLAQRFERAKAEDDLPAWVNPAHSASYVMAVSQGMAVQAKAGASKDALAGLVDHVLSTWPSSKGERGEQR
ncbi:HTH-type transcriptional repressor ComR [Sodalis praecaptivus]|nr:HTH-type transcriptional repressor ComR [Sodalis praecaptivus]